MEFKSIAFESKSDSIKEAVLIHITRIIETSENLTIGSNLFLVMVTHLCPNAIYGPVAHRTQPLTIQ